MCNFNFLMIQFQEIIQTDRKTNRENDLIPAIGGGPEIEKIKKNALEQYIKITNVIMILYLKIERKKKQLK